MTFVSSSARGGGVTAPPFVGQGWGVAAANVGLGAYTLLSVWVPTPMTFTKYAIRVMNTSGNMWLAIYNSSLARVHTVTSFAVPSSAVINTVAISGGLFLAAGSYWLAMQCDNNTATFASTGANAGVSPGVFTAANTYANGAPATAVLANPGATAYCVMIAP